MLADVLVPGPPVSAAFAIHQDERHNAAFAGLHEREGLVAFIHGAEAAREEDDGIRMAEEGEFARKEIFKCDQLLIVLNDRIGALFPRQANVCAKTSFQTRAFVSRLHNAWSR